MLPLVVHQNGEEELNGRWSGEFLEVGYSRELLAFVNYRAAAREFGDRARCACMCLLTYLLIYLLSDLLRQFRNKP